MNELRMHKKIVGLILLVICLLLGYNGVQGEKKLFKSEDMELEKRLRFLNKPAVKIVKTKYGDTYDCVNFYKQHVFDHPLLKNHNFHPQMKPTLPVIKQNSYASTTNKLLTIWSKDGGCPSGTVPVKRITKDDLIRQRDIPPSEPINFNNQFVGINNNSEQKTSYLPFYGYKRAIVQTPFDPNAKYLGAGMATNFFNPHVEGKQHSACRIKIQNGSEALQVGWRVDPVLYGDNKTRFFIHIQIGNTQSFNTLLPLFVHVNKDIPLDLSFEDYISERGITTLEMPMYIYKEKSTGNWWVLLGESYAQVGFWPNILFTDLISSATNAEWGGVIYNPPGASEPPMGSSFFPVGDTLFDAYCRSITVVNEEGDSIDVGSINWYTDNINGYKVEFKQLSNGLVSFIFALYGGPGVKNA